MFWRVWMFENQIISFWRKKIKFLDFIFENQSLRQKVQQFRQMLFGDFKLKKSNKQNNNKFQQRDHYFRYNFQSKLL